MQYLRKYKMLRLLAVVFPMILAGCQTTSAKQFQAPDGTLVKSVKCTSDSTKCFSAATQSCTGSGTYRVLSSESHAGGLAADLIPGPVTWYAMSYVCGPSDGKMPIFSWVGPTYTPPRPPPVVIQPGSTTTNCTRVGNSVNCNTY